MSSNVRPALLHQPDQQHQPPQRRVRFAAHVSVCFIEATGFNEELWQKHRALHEFNTKEEETECREPKVAGNALWTVRSIDETLHQHDPWRLQRDQHCPLHEQALRLGAAVDDTINERDNCLEKAANSIGSILMKQSGAVEDTELLQCMCDGHGLTMDDMAYVLARGIMITSAPHETVAIHAVPLRSVCSRSKESQIQILGAIEESVARSTTVGKSTIRSPLTIQALYEANLLEENTLTSWGSGEFDLELSALCEKVSDELHENIVSANKIFLDWLNASEEESEDEEDD